MDPGNIITANTTNLVIINQFQPIAVYFTLPENQLPQVLAEAARRTSSMPADAYDKSDVQKLATGQLLTADNQIDTTTGTAKLKAVFNNENEALFPEPVCEHSPGDGRTGPMRWWFRRRPSRAGLQGSFVWVVNTDDKGNHDGEDAAGEDCAGRRDSDHSGQRSCTPGQKMVVDGADRLRAGAQVRGEPGSAAAVQAERRPQDRLRRQPRGHRAGNPAAGRAGTAHSAGQAPDRRSSSEP